MLLLFRCRLTQVAYVRDKIIKTERGLRKLLRSIKLMVQVFICSANVPSCRDVVTDVLLLSHCVVGLLAYNSALYICISVTNRIDTVQAAAVRPTGWSVLGTGMYCACMHDCGVWLSIGRLPGQLTAHWTCTGADLTGGHSCSGRRGPWEVGPWRPPGLGGPWRLNFGFAIAKSWLQLELNLWYI